MLDEDKSREELLEELNISKEIINRLLKSEELYRDLFENVNDFIQMVNIDGKFIHVNNAWRNALGYTEEEVKEISIWDIIHPTQVKHCQIMFKELFNGEKLPKVETIFVTKNGEEINVEGNVNLKFVDGNPYATRGIFRDITKRKKIENDLKQALEEKEMLLKEIYHRVKNNLMVISSLLNLQSGHIKDKVALDLFRESQNRAKSMALIHERLYRSKDLKRIDFGDYIRTLATDLYKIYVHNSGQIALNLNVDDIMLDINTAVPLGLILNELVTNSMKYGFPGDIQGKIDVKFKKQGETLVLTVADDGIGFPENIDYKNTTSLGLQLVNSLTSQIDGEIKLDGAEGTEFKIIFKELYGK